MKGTKTYASQLLNILEFLLLFVGRFRLVLKQLSGPLSNLKGTVVTQKVIYALCLSCFEK